MSEQINLKELERRAYRSTFQDGLWDLYLAGLMACLGILGMISKFRDETWVWLIGYTVLVGGVWGAFMLGKKLITLPRIGTVKFGVKRKRRKTILVIILSLTVLLNIIILLLTMGVVKAPTWLQNIVNEMPQRGVMDVLVPLLAGLFVTLVMCVIAFFIDYYRGMYIAVLFGLGIIIDMIFGLPVVMVVLAVLVAIPGLIMLIRFINKYPTQAGR
jgi:MFS family permease